jgi:hypothetical protein
VNGYLAGFLAILSGIAIAVVGELVSEEIRDRLDQVPRAILRLAARWLDPGQRAAVYRDEWEPELIYILKGTEARPVTRLITGTWYGLGILASTRRIARHLHRPAPGQPDLAAADARSTKAVAALIPVLAHSLQGARIVTMPATDLELAEAVMRGLTTILQMLGDTRPVSFVIGASGANRDADIPGMLVSFGADIAASSPPDQGFLALATELAHRFADDPAGMRQLVKKHGLTTAADAGDRIRRLLSLEP